MICLLTYTIFAFNCFEMKLYAMVDISYINKMDVVVEMTGQFLVSVCMWSTGVLC